MYLVQVYVTPSDEDTTLCRKCGRPIIREGPLCWARLDTRDAGCTYTPNLDMVWCGRCIRYIDVPGTEEKRSRPGD